MQFPITLNFKILALAPQIKGVDATGREVFYVRQKLLKLKEAVTIFSDESQTTELYKINADRVIDWSARYDMTDRVGMKIGAIKRQGTRSLWKARYDIYDGSRIQYQIEEESAMVRFLDASLGEVPILGAFTGYFFNPVYNVETPQNELVMRVIKERSFLESSFTIEQVKPVDEDDQLRIVLGVLMMTLLERARG